MIREVLGYILWFAICVFISLVCQVAFHIAFPGMGWIGRVVAGLASMGLMIVVGTSSLIIRGVVEETREYLAPRQEAR